MGLMRDWRCPECRQIVGTTKAFGFGTKPDSFRCPDHPFIAPVADPPRDKKTGRYPRLTRHGAVGKGKH